MMQCSFLVFKGDMSHYHLENIQQPQNMTRLHKNNLNRVNLAIKTLTALKWVCVNAVKDNILCVSCYVKILDLAEDTHLVFSSIQLFFSQRYNLYGSYVLSTKCSVFFCLLLFLYC